MHDIRAIRENPAAFDAALSRRGLEPVSSEVLRIDEARRAAILEAETAQAERNTANTAIGFAKSGGDEAEFSRLRELISAKKSKTINMQSRAKELDDQLTKLLEGLPNLPFEDVPDGADEADNVEVHRWGTPRQFDFQPKEHFEIASVQTGLDFETAAKLSGSRFVVMSGAVARVHRALAQFMLDTHITENGLTETWTPVLVRDDMMYGTGQLPKFGEDSYQTTNGWWLVPTAEVPLTNIVNGETVDEDYLPRRYVAHTQCFRSEAGSAGRDTAGMLRQHQFEKVEMVSITHPDHSRDELDRMTGCAQGILEKLGLPYRTVVLCTGDMGFGARRTHDIEVWLPGQNTYREISSVSVCGDFQARRMNARFKPASGGKPEYLHTLNGSGLAVGRCLIAVLENGQEADGSVTLPEALHPWLGGKTRIAADGAMA
ncbi:MULTISPECIES: serine--tRNA ligase [Marivita]|uniref:Serine--tRNA ligase n=1 Tax=Marivita cryptomonadis TaxID=505252 RepID=A0A9Q2NQQ2_9RHOB|nr:MULTISPECIES: serine--tRNA ligase [Marivita]MCR9168107.1 serine--tRNA ligase [Paracoccaceae bacterium]MBM2320907.1 serine--tRNA ligase [Marivita cryptomonadis]MBM2330487.1 serine--tRNA ligase [Marivita cryptomonadis]MBM2340074.1 serine--tRNA ligase [Marivita cryptomonadis]MBM2344735.1 serine--tRNA ligase [Marivita cryptomonadis]